jgi:membrane associated rhomboid family serine protease
MYFWMFYPLGLDLPRRGLAWLSTLLVALLVLVFAWTRWWPAAFVVQPWELVFHAGASPSWTVATALLLHADWLHLIGNLVYLAVFLPPLEERVGRFGLLLLVLATGVGGNLVHGLAAWNDWMGQGGLGILGASGTISGLLGYALVRLPHARIKVAYWVFAPLQGQNRAGRSSLPLPAAVLVWLLLQIVHALVAGETGSTVSYPAHLGGFVMGLVMGVALGGLGEGRSEALLLEGRRRLAAGEGWPAAGAFSEYLEAVPHDLEARLERARALLMTGDQTRPQSAYRDVHRRAVAAGRWDLALAALGEGWRLEPGLSLDRDELASAAQEADRAGQRDLAVAVYQTLVLRGERHPAVDRAWVRLVLLLHASPAREAEAAEWLERARRELPPGAWRDYLEGEFTTRTTVGAAPAPGSPPDDRRSGA